MGVRNFEEMGTNLVLVMEKLIANEKLGKLLVNTGKDPLAGSAPTADQLMHERIRIIPRLLAGEDGAQATVILRIASGDPNENSEFRSVVLGVEIFVPFTQWVIKGKQLRPFAIMGEVQRSLNNMAIDGLGVVQILDFNLHFLTDEMSVYQLLFQWTVYE